MKILAISDVHGEDNENLYLYLKDNNIDLVLISGDITNFGPLDFVYEFVQKILDCECDVIALPGNCDPNGICNAINESGAFCLHKNIIKYDNDDVGVVLVGYGGSNPTPFDTPGEIEDNKIYEDIHELLNEYDYINNYEIPKVKILLTHAPPYNTQADLVGNGEHVGSHAILKAIHEFQPEINICGHIHEAKSIDKIEDKTIVANPGMLKDNGAILVTIGDESDYHLELVDLN